jgi:hypothetical protein
MTGQECITWAPAASSAPALAVRTLLIRSQGPIFTRSTTLERIDKRQIL